MDLDRHGRSPHWRYARMPTTGYAAHRPVSTVPRSKSLLVAPMPGPRSTLWAPLARRPQAAFQGTRSQSIEAHPDGAPRQRSGALKHLTPLRSFHPRRAPLPVKAAVKPSPVSRSSGPALVWITTPHLLEHAVVATLLWSLLLLAVFVPLSV